MDKFLGVINKKHSSGIYETDLGHKTVLGEIGMALYKGSKGLYVMSAEKSKEYEKERKKAPLLGENNA